MYVQVQLPGVGGKLAGGGMDGGELFGVEDTRRGLHLFSGSGKCGYK